MLLSVTGCSNQNSGISSETEPEVSKTTTEGDKHCLVPFLQSDL